MDIDDRIALKFQSCESRGLFEDSDLGFVGWMDPLDAMEADRDAQEAAYERFMEDQADLLESRERSSVPCLTPHPPADTLGSLGPRPVTRGPDKGRVVIDSNDLGLNKGFGQNPTLSDVAEAGVHWGRFTSDSRDVRALLDVLRQRFGAPECMRHGMWGYDRGLRYGNGIIVLEDDSSDGPLGHAIEVPGGVLDDLGGDAAVEFLAWLGVGRKCTRIDLRLDWRSSAGVGLVDDVLASCERGELCRARSYRTVMDKTADGAYRGRTVYLGSRSSQRMVRVYDKGLETGEESQGCWERWEVEFKEEAAQEVAKRLFSAAGRFAEQTGQPRIVKQLALGAVDFRMPKAGETALERRPRAAWWDRLLDGLEVVRAPVRRQQSCLESYKGWGMSTWGRKVRQMAEQTGQTMGQVMESLEFDQAKPVRDPDDFVLRQYREFVEV